MTLLDTHIFFWWEYDPPKLPASYRKFLDDPSERVAISIITFWEISMLSRKGRIELSDPFPIWMKNVIQRSKVEILGVIPEIIEAENNLPEEFHGDPADRIIAATSLAHKIKLATTDGKLTAYKFLDIL